jgi:hypothetical protein
MSLPGFLQENDRRAAAVRPAAAPPPRCEDAYVACLENCSNWPGFTACPCYCDNALCQCANPNCPQMLCE